MRRRILALHVLGLALAVSVPAARAALLPTREETAARKLYENKCAKCHKFYDPAAYSDAQWEQWTRKMGSKAKLTPEQEKLLWRYLEEKYRAPKKAGAQNRSARRAANRFDGTPMIGQSVPAARVAQG